MKLFLLACVAGLLVCATLSTADESSEKPVRAMFQVRWMQGSSPTGSVKFNHLIKFNHLHANNRATRQELELGLCEACYTIEPL